MSTSEQQLHGQQRRYAELLVQIGVNLQPGQPLVVHAEHEHAPFVHEVAGAAYRAGASFVQVDWEDDLLARERLLHSAPEHLEFVPDYTAARLREFLERGFASLALAGPQHPGALDDVAPEALRKVLAARAARTRFYNDAAMSNAFQWCVAAVPTAAWAQQIFPGLEPAAAVERLWPVILDTVRMNEPDPVAAWRAHDERLNRVAAYLMRTQVRALHFHDPAPGPDGRAATDLTVGLTDAPVWVGPSSVTPGGVRFLANMPTEEVFTSPHRLHAEGWVRTSKPGFPLGQRVENAWFRFAGGKVVEFGAERGADALAQFFQIEDADRLGEVALVDVRSPINRTGLLFHELLFDENAACHVAFGRAYFEGLAGGLEMSAEERSAAGLNGSDTHKDFMIGTPTMDVTGIAADGSRVPVMAQGQFVDAAFAAALPRDREVSA
jgi:aminopeptidase